LFKNQTVYDTLTIKYIKYIRDKPILVDTNVRSIEQYIP